MDRNFRRVYHFRQRASPHLVIVYPALQVFLQIPLAHFTEYNFTLILTDESGGSVEQTFSIRIYKENQAPVFEFEGSVISEINLEFQEDFTTEDWYDATSSLTFSDPDGDDFFLS